MGCSPLRKYGVAPFRVAVIHGDPGAGGEMSPVARRLSEKCGVLERLQTAASINGQIEELRDVLLSNAAVPVVLVGFSWGAWLSLLLGSRFPGLVSKLILVSSGVLAESYTADLRSTRLSRLREPERAEFEGAIAGLNDPAAGNHDVLLARLGSLASKADSYAPLEEPEEPCTIPVSGDIYRQVWPEAAEMRRTGELLRQAAKVVCPVLAIHGDTDPSPSAGVSEPLNAALGSFRCIVLAKCGHTPWRERYARDEFYRILLTEVG
jgi:pimeloyl-ACP methyl ester carboxylesterase